MMSVGNERERGPRRYKQHDCDTATSKHKKQRALLTSVDQDSWIGLRVKLIKSATHPDNMISGTVLKTGNGWVQVLTAQGEIAKRANELMLNDDGGGATGVDIDEYPDRKRRNRGSGNNSSSSNATVSVGSYGHTSNIPSLHIQIDCINNAGGRPRSYSEPILTPTDSSGLSYYGVSSPKWFLTCSPRPNDNFTFGQADAGVNITGSSSSASCAEQETQKNDYTDCIGTAEVVPVHGGVTTNNTESNADAETTTMKVDPRKSARISNKAISSIGADGMKEYFIKKVNPEYIKARKEYTQKYVTRVQEKIENRPDLAYWKRAITSSIMVDTKQELQLARRGIDECFYYCQSCGLEKWEGGMFCWNEKCMLSPIYHKLPGAGVSNTTNTISDANVTVSSRTSVPDIYSDVSNPGHRIADVTGNTRAENISPSSTSAVFVTPETNDSVASKKHFSGISEPRKLHVSLIENASSVVGNNCNYLSSYGDDASHSSAVVKHHAATESSTDSISVTNDIYEHNHYYEHPYPKLPKLSTIVDADIHDNAFTRILELKNSVPPSHVLEDHQEIISRSKSNEHVDNEATNGELVTHMSNDACNLLHGGALGTYKSIILSESGSA